MWLRSERLLELVGEALPESLTWAGALPETQLAALPARPAVYLLLTRAHLPVQLAATQDLRRAVRARLLDTGGTRPGRTDLTEIVEGVRWRGVHSAFEGSWWYYRLARRMYPKRYRRMISFGPAWFLNVDWEQPIPDIRVTERVWNVPGECVGPWLTHDMCCQALDWLRDLFDLCREPEQVQRTPRGRRCAYADMDRCDAPCDGSAPLEAYIQRCRAAWAFVLGEVRPWIDAAKQRMKAAAEAQRFEEAGQLKRQLARAWKWHDNFRPYICPAEAFNHLLALPVPRRRAWRLFLFWQGDLVDGPVVSERRLPAEAPAWLAEALARRPEPAAAQIRMEQTWLVAHFLRSRSGDAALVERLPSPEVPDDLEGRLAERLAERRASPAAGPPGADQEPAGSDASALEPRKNGPRDANSFDSGPNQDDT